MEVRRSDLIYQGIVWMKPRTLGTVLVLVLLSVLVGACSESSSGNEVSVQEAPFPDDVTRNAIDSVMHYDELLNYLNSQFLLKHLGVEEITILETDVDKAIIGSASTQEPLGEVYYTIQDGWHLRRENERMEHVPGKGWLIWEQ
jgi:hypothetical protein